MKVNRIEVQNFKAIGNEVVDFNGCSAIVTGGNNKGKTTLLKGLINRFRSEKPELILKEGEKKGYSVLELTDGSRFEWKFTGKSESFCLITKEGVKQTTGVLKSVGLRYFGTNFDIDKFLNSSSSVQSKILQKLIGIDFTDIDARYKIAYDNRTYANKRFTQIAGDKQEAPQKIVFKDVEKLKEQIYTIELKNDNSVKNYRIKNNQARTEIENFNSKQNIIENANNVLKAKFSELKRFKNSDFEKFINFEEAERFILNLEIPKEIKIFTEIPFPERIKTNDLQNEITEIQTQQINYNVKLNNYNLWIEQGQEARTEKEKYEKEVKKILEEKQAIIKKAKLPENFKFTGTGINYNGFPLSSNQVSSSQKYIAGLKLGAMVLGELKTLHFDASFLDKNSLQEVQDWAIANDYQLLIERPDFDGGEIKYEII